MKRLVALMMCAVSLGAAAQVTYPYNPDEDGNGQIAVGDLQGILATYGNAFSPSEILVDGETLTTVLTQLQNSIDSLSGLTGGGGSVLDMPLGTVLPIATESVPEGWMLCDGREISIEEYQGLYDLIGTTYGAGDSAFWAQVFYPATTFNIPDLRGRTIIGANDMGGEESDVIVEHFAKIGEKGGAEMHSLTEAELPEHTHEVQYFRRTYGSGAGHPWNGTAGDYSSAGDPQWVSNSVVRAAGGGGNQPHNIMQPYMALNYMIKVQAVEDVVVGLQEQIAGLEAHVDSLNTSVLIVDVSQGFSENSADPELLPSTHDVIVLVGDRPFGMNYNDYVYFQLQPSEDGRRITIVNGSEFYARGLWGGYSFSNGYFSDHVFFAGSWYRDHSSTTY